MARDAKSIAAEMHKRFPISAPVVADGDVDTNYQVGVPEFKISLNKTAPIEQMGRCDATVHVQSHDNWSGFQGGAYYKFMDEKGNIVYAILGDVYGVNGKDVPGAPDNTTKMQTFFVPLEILTAVYSCEAVRARLEGPALDKIKQTVSEFAKGADAIKDDLKTIGVAVGEIYLAIQAL